MRNSITGIERMLADCYDSQMDKPPPRSARRRDALLKLIEHFVPARFEKQHEMAAALGLAPAHLSQMKSGHRTIGNDSADRIEQGLGLDAGALDHGERVLLPPTSGANVLSEQEAPDNNKGINMQSNIVRLRQHDEPSEDGYVRMALMSPRPSAGSGSVVSEVPYVVRHLDVLESWARTTLGCADPLRVKLLTCVGDSMENTIKDRDVVFVDLAQNRFTHPGIYVLSIGESLIVKRLDMTVTGDLDVISDNRDKYAPQRVHASDLDQVNIAGRVLGWWTLKTS